jgi:hypothetical protein
MDRHFGMLGDIGDDAADDIIVFAAEIIKREEHCGYNSGRDDPAEYFILRKE